jgi:hypothetical protein
VRVQKYVSWNIRLLIHPESQQTMFLQIDGRLEMKEYKCRKVNTSLIIDGNLDKPEWKLANTVELVDTVTGSKPRLNTSVKLLWNSEFLYAGFCCEDDYLCATMTGYNEKIYEEDVVELFIDDDKDMKTYIEIEVNPLNTVLHYCVHNSLNRKILGFARVEKIINSAVTFDEEKSLLTVEIAIPFTEFVTAGNNSPNEGDRWGINIFRIDRAKEGLDEYTAWAPTKEINFHIPEKFGELVFE